MSFFNTCTYVGTGRTYIGCLSDSNDRTLPDHYMSSQSSMTLELCEQVKSFFYKLVKILRWLISCTT